MRAGTLSDPTVAALVEEGFACAWEKKGAVESYRVRGSRGWSFKGGGNILTYVCAPRGEVIHAIPGASEPEAYREELDWARTLHFELAGLSPEDATSHLRAAHRDRAVGRGEEGLSLGAHGLLSSRGFLPVAEVERQFFEILLSQTYAPDRDIVIRELDPDDFKALMASRPMR